MATRYIFEIEDMPTTSILKEDPRFRLKISGIDLNKKNVLVSAYKPGVTIEYELPIGQTYIVGWDKALVSANVEN